MEIVFVIATLICIVLLVFSLRKKRKNYGFVLTTLLLVVCNIACMLMFRSQSIKSIRKQLLVYYIAYAWMFLGSAWTIARIAASKRIRLVIAVMGSVSVAMTAMICYCFFARGKIEFAKKILLGRIWWIVKPVQGARGLLSFNTFDAVCILSALAVIGFCVVYVVKTHRMFRGKYICFIINQTLLLSVGIAGGVYDFPVWIFTLIMNPICYITYYFAFIQSDLKLRNEVIMSFANEMSDGLILYNAYNNLIHVNDLIKNLIDSSFLEKLKDINVLEEWISHMEYVENIKTLLYRKGDEEIYFTVGKHEFGTKENLVGTAYILHNTTNSINQIRLMEKVNSELERTSRMKSDFLANMSHELRTPMNAVIGMTEIALREDLPFRVKDCLNQINSSGRNLLNIINDILDYSKIDAGKMEIIPEKYEPLSEVNDVANILLTRIGNKRLELYYIVDPKIPHELMGDCMRIRQVLINLANNAVKFSEVGMIKITLDCEWISDDEVELTYHIIDTGQGIKEEDLNRLFVSFTQVDSKRNRNVEGTGLGLAISKSLCEAMGGTIGVSSEYGKGSDFWFKVPQKVVDKRCDLVVDDAKNKVAFCINDKRGMTGEFEKEMAALGLEGRVIASIREYEPTEKEDIILFEEDRYNDDVKRFLDSHPEVSGVILTGFGSSFRPDRKNLRVLSRPMTTLAMVMALSNRDLGSFISLRRGDEVAEFIAPDARVLIVDDNNINLSIAVGLLEPLKINCDVAQSGYEALEKAGQNKYDLILMDHMMPGMDGIETTREIREKIPAAEGTPIVALTANVMEGSKEMFLEAGMVDVIAKPIDVKQLNSKLYALLPGDRIHVLSEEELAEMKNETRDDYVSYDFLDYEKAIQGLGSASLYRKILSEYYKRGPRTMEEIEEALSANDLADYAIKTHALKSSSRQIGATELGDIAEKLEHAGKGEDTAVIEQYHATAMQLLKKLLDDLSEYFSVVTGEAADLPPASDDEIRAVFDKLSSACDNLEMDEMEECAEKLRSYSYPEDKKELIDKLCNAIEMMDTDGCAEIMGSYFG